MILFQQFINRMPLLKCPYIVSFPSDYVPILPKGIVAFINTQRSNMRREHSIMIANSRHKLYFADSLGRPSFHKQQYKQVMPQTLQLIQAFEVSTGYMQLFIFSRSDKMKLLDFAMSMYFRF